MGQDRTAALLGRLAGIAIGVGILLIAAAIAHESRTGLTADLFDAVVALHAEVAADARTSAILGTEREGAAVVIDADGLAVTIGYLVMEAASIELTLGNGKKVPASVVGL